MPAFACPSCGATVNFESSITVSAVCESCRSLIIRKDLNVETLGTVAMLPPDLSPLQIGTTGTLGGLGFRLLGRLRWRWSGGAWTEWFAECADGRRAWIAESQGFFTFSAETPAEKLPPVGLMSAGAAPFINNRQWTVVDVKETTLVGGEGGLPQMLPPGRPRTSADMAAPGGRFATVEEGPDGADYYEGCYARFEELHLANLRDVPGWTPGVELTRNERDAQSFSCPNCGAPVTVRAAGLTMSAVCGSCGTVIDTSDERRRRLEDAAEKIRVHEPEIPLGRRGKLGGVEWEAVGFMRRTDGEEPWSEILLFNPWHGFDWLVTVRGHWTRVQRMLDEPDDRLLTNGFRAYAAYPAAVLGVLGEFYWQTSTAEKAYVKDWISPPAVISRERYPDLNEVTWSRGEYVPADEVKRAFGLEAPAKPEGFVPNQPNPFRERWGTLRWYWWAALAVLLATQIYSASTSSTREVFSGSFDHRRGGDANRVQTSEPFELAGGPGRVEITADAPNLSNAWVAIDVSLVEEGTGKRYDADIDLEFYSGRDEDGPWTEGSRSGSASLGSVPPGRYRLAIETASDPAPGSPGATPGGASAGTGSPSAWGGAFADLAAQANVIPFNVRVERGGVFWGNFWLALLVLVAYPLWQRVRALLFEQQRGGQSDLAAEAAEPPSRPRSSPPPLPPPIPFPNAPPLPPR